jgi:hypothetical protein
MWTNVKLTENHMNLNPMAKDIFDAKTGGRSCSDRKDPWRNVANFKYATNSMFVVC